MMLVKNDETPVNIETLPIASEQMGGFGTN
jgi:hypothetical protein